MIGSLKNEGLFQSMFQLTAEGVFVLDKDGTILMANPACKNLFGYNPDDLLGKHIEVLITENHRKKLKNQISKLENTTLSKDLDLVGIINNGTEIKLEIRLNYTVINGKHLTIAFLRDISNRAESLLEIKKTNLALIESNRKFDALINNLQGIVYRCKNNRDWTMEYISEGCEQITGYNAQSFLNGIVHFSQITLQEDEEQVWNGIQKGINNKKPFTLNYRIRDKKGKVRHMQELGQGVFDKNGNLEAIEGFISDVTSQKETELVLKANESKIKALLEVIPDMMFIQDYHGKYLNFYAPLKQKLVTPPEGIIGKNMIDILPPSTYKIVKEAQEKTIATKQMQLIEYEIKENGKTYHYEARIAPLNSHSILSIVRNISEAKTQEALLKIRDNALASADNGIIISDAQQSNTPIIYCNAAFEKITGYKKEEVYGKNCNFLQSDDRHQSEIMTMKNAIEKGKSCKVVLRNYKKDGTLFWNEVAITPILNQKNELTHFIGVQNDVTKRIKEEHLKNKIRGILELITYDKSLKTIANSILETVEAHIKDSIVSVQLLNKQTKTLYTLAAPHLPKTIIDFIEGITIGPKIGPCETATAFLKKKVIVSNIEQHDFSEDYKTIALKNSLKSCWSFPILSSTNQVLGVFTIYNKNKRSPSDNELKIILDATNLCSVAIEKQYNINALKESKNQLENYASKLEDKVQERTQEVMATVEKLVKTNLNLEDQILITEEAKKNALESRALTAAIAKNFPKGFILIINKAMQLVLAEGEVLDQLGLKPLIFKGMTLDDISSFSENRKAKIKESISKTFSGTHLSFEIEYKNRYYSVNTAPLFDENNQISNALMVYNDISEQKEIEFSIKNALKKEIELNELKSRFVSMASHEFRTPLSVILTSAILMSKQNKQEKEVKREKHLVQIEKNINHLVTILNDFLSLSKLEEGKIKAVKEDFDIIYFTKTIITENKIGLKKGQQIHFSTTVNTLFVHLDIKLLRHIITNLLSNASKYSEEHTDIYFKIIQNKNKVIIQLTDQGIGIPEEDRARLFHRFYRANNAINIEGTGLGLNIAKHYTELMNGSIGFKSTLNKGTTFWIELPIIE